MDLRQFIFPFIMAVITNSIMIVIIYFLRKTPYFANLFGVGFMVILYLFCIVRMFLPIEIPGLQVIIRDNSVYNSVVEGLIKRSSDGPGTPSSLFYLILGVWIGTALILGTVFYVKQKNYRTYILANSDSATDDERELLKKTAAGILGTDKSICLCKSDAVNRIMVMGFLKKIILLPDGEYADTQLEMILRHECTHIKNKDLWLKLLIQIYCCIFWWNPFSYLLKHDLAFSLEMKCDLSVVRDFTPDQTLVYLNTIHSSVKEQKENKTARRESFLVCAELSNVRKSKELIKRIRAITAEPPRKAVKATVNAVAAAVILGVFVISYIFIVQPFFGIDVDTDEYNLSEKGVVVDESNSYLVKQDDGSYLFYYKDYPPIPATKEEIEQGLYEGYPIYE